MSLRFVVSDSPFAKHVNRREWLRIGSVASLGYGAGLDSNSATAEPHSKTSTFAGFGRAKSVIVLYASGGQSQLDTWDMKPESPDGIRSEFAPIATTIPGVQVCEHMPRIARIANRFSILRTMSHDDLDHGSATYLSLTGQFHPRKSSNFPPRPEDAPALGAILQRIQPPQQFPYSAIQLNGPVLIPDVPSPGQYGGFLGRSYEPLMVGDVTSSAATFSGLESLADLPTVRQSARTSLLTAIDQTRQRFESNRPVLAMNELYRQAYSVLSSPRCQQAFDLSREQPSLRDRYGRFRSGQACLLARRLVEAEVPLITVFLSQSARGQDLEPDVTESYGWDTHNDIFVSMKQHLLPRFDICFSALLEDLEQRGLLETTLVICLGEFGRAPRIALEPNFAGSTPGRKHWAATYSIVVAGAGVGRGQVIGSSDRIGAYPETTPFSPGDLSATIFNALGIDPTSHYHDNVNRPIPIATGRPIEELYA